MAANAESSDRQVVPRWCAFRDALASNELAAGAPADVRSIDGTEFLKEKEAAWLENQSISFAIDLISAATVLGSSLLTNQAAEFILQNASEGSASAQKLARGILGIREPEIVIELQPSRMQVIQRVKQLKAKRISQPRNAFVWVDLARLYVLLGQNEPARQALNVALKLAPTERFVARCNARFLHHIHEHEEALQLLRKNSRTPFDPWLVAAEIAASSVAKKTPKFSKVGSQLLGNGSVAPFHTSELASALASLEMEAGNTRGANKLFAQSLRDPTGNSLAQAVWASKQTGFGVVNAQVLENAHASEALAWNAFNEANWPQVIVAAEKWAQEEAFSARPALLSSSTAATFLDQPKLAEEIARRGLETNPGHPILINNLAFALILQGNPLAGLAAMEKVSRTRVSVQNGIHLLATTGFAYFRLGNEEEGRKYYELAIDSAVGQENERLKIVARLYLGRERALRGDKDGIREFGKAYEAAEKRQQTLLPAIAEQLANDVEQAAARFGIQTQFKRIKQIVPEKGPLL